MGLNSSSSNFIPNRKQWTSYMNKNTTSHYDGVSNHQPHGCLRNRLFRRRSKKTSKLRVTGLCVVNSPGPVNSPHKGPVTRKMFPFDDVIMCKLFCWWSENEEPWHFRKNVSPFLRTLTTRNIKTMGPILITVIHFKISAWISDYTQYIWCGMKLLIHSQTWTVQPLRFGSVIFPHTL